MPSSYSLAANCVCAVGRQGRLFTFMLWLWPLGQIDASRGKKRGERFFPFLLLKLSNDGGNVVSNKNCVQVAHPWPGARQLG